MISTETFARYLRDVVSELKQDTGEARAEREDASGPERQFSEGKLFAYVAVLGLLRNQAIAFDIDPVLLGLDKDPDVEFG